MIPFVRMLQYGSVAESVGQINFIDPGVYEFTVPEGCTSICAVVIGGGGGSWQHGTTVQSKSGGGGGGGGLSYRNDIPVVSGEILTITVGQAGITLYNTSTGSTTAGGDSTISRDGDILIIAGGGRPGLFTTNGSYARGTGGLGGKNASTINDGGANGGTGGDGAYYNNGSGGAGGAGGYSGAGGSGGTGASTNGSNGTGGAGGGGSGTGSRGASSGGTGLYGEGKNGTGGVNGGSGTSGSIDMGSILSFGAAGRGSTGNTRSSGGVRIIWGANRAYPNQNTSDL